MNFLTSVHTQYHVRHLFITEFHHFIIQKYSVCGQCKTEFLIMKLSPALVPYFTRSFTTCQFIRGSPPKKSTSRFLLASGIGDQEIQSFLSDFIGTSGLFCHDILPLRQNNSGRPDCSHAQYAGTMLLQRSAGCLKILQLHSQ